MEFLKKFDKQQVQKITLIVIAALTILALVLLLVVIVASVNPSSPFGISGGISNQVDYTVTDKDISTGYLVLADDDHPYTLNETLVTLLKCQDYRNKYLKDNGVTDTQINDKTNPDRYKLLRYMPYDKMKLQEEAMIAAHNMLIAATNANMEEYGPITIDTAYGQTTHLKGHAQEINTALAIYLTDGKSETSSFKALPQGHSEWFNKHAAEYGFIESFENGYRYVGVVHAKAISEDKNIDSLAEYIAYLKANTSVDKTVEITVNDATYKIYYVACKAGDTIKVPAEAYTISGTNEGGVIITVKVK